MSPYTQRVSSRISDIVTVAVLAFVGVRLVSGVRHSFAAQGRIVATQIIRGIRVRHVWPVPLVLTGVIVVASLLNTIPVLSWGWWSAFGGEGNPVFGSSESTAGTVWEWLVPAIFIILLFPALPLFAYAEELLFRRGSEVWSASRRALKVVQFGLVHALIGISIGTALALSIGGAYFMFVYLRTFRRTGSVNEATFESTRAHAVYNAVIVALVAVVIGLIASGAAQ